MLEVTQKCHNFQLRVFEKKRVETNRVKCAGLFIDTKPTVEFCLFEVYWN